MHTSWRLAELQATQMTNTHAYLKLRQPTVPYQTPTCAAAGEKPVEFLVPVLAALSNYGGN